MLNNAAAIPVTRHIPDTSRHGIEDKVGVPVRKFQQNPLDDILCYFDAVVGVGIVVVVPSPLSPSSSSSLSSLSSPNPTLFHSLLGVKAVEGYQVRKEAVVRNVEPSSTVVNECRWKHQEFRMRLSAQYIQKEMRER